MSQRAPQNILLIQLRRIGDVLMTTPCIRALKQAWPESRISFLTERPSDQLLRHNPHVDEIIEFPRSPNFRVYLRLLKEIHNKSFDLVIDFFGNPRSAQIAFATRAESRVGFDFRGRRWAYTHKVGMPEGPQYAPYHKAILLKPLGIEVDDVRLDFFVSAAERQFADQLFEKLGVTPADKVVSISPVSRQTYKVWPPERFAEIADYLIERYGVKILFLYGPNEEQFVQKVRGHMNHQALPDYPPPTLGETRALFEKVVLHLGNDNGPCHFAIAAGTPTVAVFGKPKAINWTPPDSERHLAVEFDPGCKNDCTWPKCGHLNCINQVSTSAVQQQVVKLIESILQEDPHV